MKRILHLILATAGLLAQGGSQAKATPAESPVITTPPSNQMVDLGANASLTVSATGPLLNYQWRKNGTNLTNIGHISGSATSNLTVNGFAAADAGNYDVVITNSFGAVTSSVATLTVATRIVLLSGSLAFGNVRVSLLAQKTLTIANTGNSSLTVSNIAYPTGFSGDWAGIVPPGGSTNVVVTFTPTSAATYGNTVTVNCDATSGTRTEAISGTGTPEFTRVISLTGTLTFGDVPLNATAHCTLTIANTGNSTMTVNGITCPGGFGSSWTGKLPAGAKTNVAIFFTPVSLTIYGGSVKVNSDATSGYSTRALSGTGIATAPSLAIQPQGTDMVLTWPTNTTGFTLQYLTNLAVTDWTANAKSPVVVNGHYTLTNPSTASPLYFRLIHP